MNRYISYALVLLALLALSGCAEKLNLQPYQSVSEELALSSDGNVKTVLNGAYDALSDGDLFGGNILRNAELLGGDNEIAWVGTFNGPREIFNKALITTNGEVESAWTESYQTINVANNVIASLEVVVADDKSRVEGEALFIRSLLYFELVRYFAPQYDASTTGAAGVPLVLTPTRGVTDASKVTRATVEQVYTQVINDLTRAEGLLPEENDQYATKSAAAALLARVYLQKGDYASAASAASRVIESGLYELNADYADAFNLDENSGEDIFAIQLTEQDGVNNMNTFFSIPIYGGRDGDIEILTDHLALYDSADARLAFFYEGNGAIRSGKWNNQFGNVSVFRLAEMYLIRAEANQRLGTSTGATPLEDYNEVHTRAGLDAATAVTLEDILLERRLELAHEGFRIHDQKRLKEAVGGRPSTDNKLVFPIPQREINANPNLTQNAGY
ncbi:MAG: RagB/SusD family nutrient uptake outer membrane protein [Bacteroidetes bacterium]|nr:MAG: RagB/SusD family nutrient uptake outer membrane protein [Bacteroidota bacterium]